MNSIGMRMTRSDMVDLLRTNPNYFFYNLSRDFMGTLNITEELAEPNEIIIQEGEPADDPFLIFPRLNPYWIVINGKKKKIETSPVGELSLIQKITNLGKPIRMAGIQADEKEIPYIKVSGFLKKENFLKLYNEEGLVFLKRIGQRPITLAIDLTDINLAQNRKKAPIDLEVLPDYIPKEREEAIHYLDKSLKSPFGLLPNLTKMIRKGFEKGDIRLISYNKNELVISEKNKPKEAFLYIPFDDGQYDIYKGGEIQRRVKDGIPFGTLMFLQKWSGYIVKIRTADIKSCQKGFQCIRISERFIDQLSEKYQTEVLFWGFRNVIELIRTLNKEITTV